MAPNWSKIGSKILKNGVPNRSKIAFTINCECEDGFWSIWDPILNVFWHQNRTKIGWQVNINVTCGICWNHSKTNVFTMFWQHAATAFWWLLDSKKPQKRENGYVWWRMNNEGLWWWLWWDNENDSDNHGNSDHDRIDKGWWNHWGCRMVIRSFWIMIRMTVWMMIWMIIIK